MKVDKNKNYYKILELEVPNISKESELFESENKKYLKNLTNSEIKVKYRELSKKYHPDRNNGSEHMFKYVVEAYKVLSNETLRNEYDTKSEHGVLYDFKTQLYTFEFSNEKIVSDNLNKKYESFKKKELIDILIKLDNFQETIVYERYISCKRCDSTGLDTDLADMYDCEICDGTGEDNRGNKCTFCKGTGKMLLGFDKCSVCKGEKVILKKEKLTLREDMFNSENKCIIPFKGNVSKNEVGKIGSLYIIIK